ncbi:MAG: tRNA pseudouridine(55) synthase TruB [Chromatiales bacterium]|nr:tRNA pseudouridine(55) synthase TruB [Chromatiales bacterium]
MRRRRNRGRNVNGVLLLDKPVGMTSNAALQTVKNIFKAAKAGHTGSLDPLASGLLPICMGEATKISTYLLDADKRYWVQVRLGVTTTTGDAEGEVLETKPVPEFTEAELERVLDSYRGEIEQVPPMYSALKHQGQRLYDLARQGIEVEREPRKVTIFALALLAVEGDMLTLDVHCSKGTYVRTLAEDIGGDLGVGAHVIALRRTQVGPYRAEDMVPLESMEALANERFEVMDAKLLPVESALEGWPPVTLSEDAAYYLLQGQPVIVPRAPTEGWVRLYTQESRFLGVGEIQDDGRVAPRRLVKQNTLGS